MTTVYVVVPEGIDDPARPSGGNTYDRRICHGLAAVGWTVLERAVPARWPRPDAAARAALTVVIGGIPDGSVVLLDGLIASTVPEVLVPESTRLRLVVLVHMPLGNRDGDARARERAVLSASATVVTTSSCTRRLLAVRYALRPSRVHVVEPGVEAADLAPPSLGGGELLCVAALTQPKGQDVLLAALSTVLDLAWDCTCIGSRDLDPSFAAGLGRQSRDGGTADRVRFAGPLTGEDLNAAYAASDVLVLASRAETYGMVVTEALARGIPVIATNVGGLPTALGRGSDGCLPGLLVPPGDHAAFGAALRRWLVDADLRERLRAAARERRLSLPGWSTAVGHLSRVLAEVAA